MWQTLQENPLGVSLGYILITGAIAKLARIILLNLIESKFYQSVLLELIATFELCATVFELGIVMGTQGFVTYTGIMLILFNYWGSAWKGATASPQAHIINFLKKSINFNFMAAKIVAQIIAASSVYTLYVKPIWSLGFRTKHLEMLRQTHCSTHLQVPLISGVIIEAAATLTFLTALKIFGPRKYNYLVLPLVLVSIVYSGMTYTGAYFNPILATTIQFGCGGITAPQHFLVYWIGPILGEAVNSITSKVFDKFDNIDKKNQ